MQLNGESFDYKPFHFDYSMLCRVVIALTSVYSCGKYVHVQM